MKKYFCVSDIHSFFTPFEKALDKAEFDINNSDHVLIIDGDIFDRGHETIKVYEFLQSIPKERRIMIQGNHELLYLSLLEKAFPQNHDFHNGTVETFCQIAQIDPKELDWQSEWIYGVINGDNRTKDQIQKAAISTWKKIIKIVKAHPITQWLKSNEWVHYYELDRYIITHSFIPLKIKDIPETKWLKHYPVSQAPPEYLEPIDNWRELNYFDLSWNEAKWGCPYQLFDNHLFDKETENGKTLICGHWHTSDFHERYEDIKNDYGIYFGKNLIALDACIAYTGDCNILIIDEESGKCYNQNRIELQVLPNFTERDKENNV